MSKTIRLNPLSQSSIQNALKEIQKYKDGLYYKSALLIERLTEIGIETVNSVMARVPASESGGPDKYTVEPLALSETGPIIGAGLRLSGEQVLFIEFSAGIRYGTDSYPTPAGAPYGMGTYPGKGHWDDPWGWWYKGDDGEWHHTYGNPAYMPMYHAVESIMQAVEEVARQVFGG